MDTGDQIEVISGTARKTLKIEHVSRHRVTLYWPLAGSYDVDLTTGHLIHQVLPVNGIYVVDLQTGRVEGTRCSVSPSDMLRIEELRPGDTLKLVHDRSGAVQVDVVDALPSEGVLKIFVRTRRDAYAIGNTYRTGWRVPPEALRVLRERAGIRVAAAS